MKISSITLIIMSLLLLLSELPVLSQDDIQTWYGKSLNINNTGMYVLGTWAVINISIGAIGWYNSSGEKLYFNQMNLFWNVINLSIAGLALYSNFNSDYSLLGSSELLSKYQKTENLFLINSALDVGYISAGFLLRHLSSGSEKRADLLKGYGNSVILQGSFLLVFDLVMYGLMRDHSMDFMLGTSLSVTTESIMVGLRLNF